MCSPIYMIFRWQDTPAPTHPLWQNSWTWPNRKYEISGIGAVFYRERETASFLQKKALLRVTSGIQHSAWLSAANTANVIANRSFQSSHPAHLESSESGGNPADRGQWCPPRPAITSRGWEWNPELQCPHSSARRVGCLGWKLQTWAGICLGSTGNVPG